MEMHLQNDMVCQAQYRMALQLFQIEQLVVGMQTFADLGPAALGRGNCHLMAASLPQCARCGLPALSQLAPVLNGTSTA